MSDQYSEALNHAAEETFQSLAYMFPVPEDEAPPGARAERSIVRVDFQGPLCGTVVLSVSTCMLPTLASNMMGLEEGEIASTEQQRDALKELLNVVCGNLLPAIGTAQAVFNVRAPQIVGTGEPVPVIGQSAGTARIALDTGLADLQLYVQPQPATVVA